MRNIKKFIWLALFPLLLTSCGKSDVNPSSSTSTSQETAVITVVNGTGGGTYDIGSQATIRANIPTGLSFNYWEKGGKNVSIENPYTFTVTEDATYKATFKSVATLTVINGTGSGTYDVGTTVTVTATPKQGEVFKYWQISGETVSTQITYQFVLTGNTTITAVMDTTGGDYVLDYTKTLTMTGDTFKVLNLTDIQLCDGDTTTMSKHVIDTLVERVKPDMITFLGDILNDSKSYDAKVKPFEVLTYIDSFNIPWAPIFGNHDTIEYGGKSPERTVGVKELMEFFDKCNNCLFIEGPSDVLGKSNYVIDIVDSGNKHVESFLMFDSYTSGLQESHITFYNDIVESLKRRNNNVTVPTVLFDHIPIQQYADARKNTEAVEYRDVIGCSYGQILAAGTSDLFKQIKSYGSTKTVICGHDHENAYYTTYEGVKLAYAMKSSDGDDKEGVNFKHGVGGLLLTIDGKNEDQLKYEKVEDIGYTFGTGCEVTSYDFHPNILPYWRYSGAKLKFDVEVPNDGKVDFNIQGTNLYRNDAKLRLGAWNRLTGNITLDAKNKTVDYGTLSLISGNKYSFEVDVSTINLNTSGDEKAIGDETARIVYFWHTEGVFTITNVRYEFEEIKETDQIDLSTAVIADIATQSYNGGKPIKPTPKVTVSGTELKPIDHILYTYKDNVEAGTATLTIVPSGKGAHYYKGVISKTFTIEIPQRGVLRTNTTPIDFTSIDVVKGGTLTIDYKYVDSEVDKDHGVSFYLGVDDTNRFGKYKIFYNKLEKDFAGITFSTLTDGYNRLSIDITKLTDVPSGSTKPTKVSQISFQYFEATTGIYFDIKSEPIEDPARGSEFKAGVNVGFTLSTPIALTEKITIDFRFNSASNTSLNLFLGDGWDNYFGYYKVNANGTLGSTYSGVSISELPDGYFRTVFDLAKLGNYGQNVTKINEINLFHIRGGWTDASGFYDINPKETIFKMTGSSYKVCNFADIHVDNVSQLDLDQPVGKTIDYAITTDKPDLITFSGDVAWNSTHLNALCSLMDGYEIPYFFVLGNHDREAQGQTAESIAECINKSKYGYFNIGPTGLGSEGNYAIQIQNSSGELVHGLVMMDSGDKTTIDESKIEYVSEQVEGVKYGSYGGNKTYCDSQGWTGVRNSAQLSWYEKTVDSLGCDTTLITHMPFVEYVKAYELYQKALKSGDQSKIDACAPIGQCNMGEVCCGPVENFGFFDLITKHGSTKNVICGHDHSNDFSLLYNGVRLTYGLKTGNGYGWASADRSGYTTLIIDSTGKTTLSQNYYNPIS